MIEFDRILYVIRSLDMRSHVIPGSDVDGDSVFKIPDPLRGFVAFKRFCRLPSHRDY
jgi:hypothetical protein